ncbi:hypothetical protein [Clostridium sp. BJN0013]|uniref:hypothetical protein n=1 Tax=Clostridium sp. BJN0013 TaxID=3236840 RepID=UPI0034C6D3AE
MINLWELKAELPFYVRPPLLKRIKEQIEKLTEMVSKEDYRNIINERIFWYSNFPALMLY